ncbi:hypothetical protein [Aquimarina pacifica]|uniref:hypothetical protein n=1 Tax=Aquimarina pacifica TaxID=1296415 RepID=UPI0004712C55|nr:hypothetical protein [Aquimarina pacifica]
MFIDYSVSLLSLDTYISNYNKSVDKAHKIRGAHLLTAKELIRVYGKKNFHHKASKMTRDTIPQLRINNPYLAKLTQLSERTIRRHLCRLQEAGVIIKKIFRGRERNFDLWINPDILCINGLITPKNEEAASKFLNTVNQMFKKSKVSKCPPKDARNLAKSKNNILIAVDKSQQPIIKNERFHPKTSKKQRSLLPQTTSSNFAGYTQLKDLQRCDTSLDSTQLKEVSRHIEGNAHIKVPSKIPCIKASTCSDTSARHTFMRSYADQLWDFARKKLYKDTFLTPYQHTIATQLLYGWYNTVATTSLKKAHEEYKERILLAAKYVGKCPEKRFIPLPHIYFDIQNLTGFRGTKKWYTLEKKHRKSVAIQRIVHAQIQKFKRNERLDTGVARPRIQVLLECKKRIEQLQNPIYTEQFSKAVYHILHH